MILILQVLNSINEFYINPQDYLIVYFTILGILVTLIAITSSLTKEIRQDLIVKYYLKSKFVILYLIYIVITFIITCLIYYLDSKYLNATIFILFIITFLITLIFSGLFIIRLTRNWLYSQIFEEFQKEVNSKKGIRKESSKLNYSKTQLESLDSLIKNFSYVEKNNQDFIEEVKTIKRIVKYCITNDRLTIVIDFFNNDVIRINNTSFFENLISMLYELKFENHENLVLERLYQNFLYNLVMENFFRAKEFNLRLNTSGLYLKEFLDIRYIGEFKTTENDIWINNYEALIFNTIDKLYDLCRLLITIDIEPKTKKRYLLTQLGYLNMVLEHYDYLHETDFLKEYYDINVTSSKKEIADKKIGIIKKQKKYLKEKQLEIFYLILHNIDKDELQSYFFEIALKFYNLKDFDIQYYKHERFDKLDWLNYDQFTGGAQAIASFNFNKYRLLISFYKYLKTGNVDIKKFENENFTDNTSSFEKELENITGEFISKYFDYEKTRFEQFKKQSLKEIKEKKESLKKDKQTYIIKTSLKNEYENKFIKDCKEAWNDNQKNLSKFMQLQPVVGGNRIKTLFGEYTTLYEKEWFLDSFNKDVDISRDSGKNFGLSQGNSKTKQVLYLINKLFDKQKDKEIVVRDVLSDLEKEIQPNKEYYLFYSSELDLYKIPKLDWNRQGMEIANTIINNSKIHLCYSFNPEILLFEKDSFILKQYSQGYENKDETLVVQIEILSKDEEIKRILKSNKSFKTVEDVKQMVKIRIAEKFEVERNDDAKLIRIKV